MRIDHEDTRIRIIASCEGFQDRRHSVGLAATRGAQNSRMSRDEPIQVEVGDEVFRGGMNADRDLSVCRRPVN